MRSNSHRVEQVSLHGYRTLKGFLVWVFVLVSAVAVLVSLMMWVGAKDNLKAENGSLTIARKSLNEITEVQANHEKARRLVRQYIFEVDASNVDSVGKLICPEVSADVRDRELKGVNAGYKIYHRIMSVEDSGNKNIFTVVTDWWNDSNETGKFRWNVNIEKYCIIF